MSHSKKERLDLLIQASHPNLTRNQIQSFIMQGLVTVEGEVITKAGHQTPADAVIVLAESAPKFVCRAGFKLEKALESFGIDVTDFVVLDSGLSTGGFTDCLVQNGAAKVYGVDVGYNQVHEKIRSHPKVEVLEQTNLRYLTSVGELVDLVTLDLSFISVLKVMHTVLAVLKPTGFLVVLIKPQFEAARHEVGRGGVIKDEQIHEAVVKNVTEGIIQFGFELQGVIESPLLGAAGNKEFLAFFKRK